MESVVLILNFVVAGVAIALSITAILLAQKNSAEAKKSLDKANAIMSQMETKIGGIEEVIKGQIKEAWDVFMKQARGEGRIPGPREMESMTQMASFLKSMGLENEMKKVFGEAMRKGLTGK